MRKQQQKQILELLKTIEEAQEAGLYTDCQDCAIVVGEFIENIKEVFGSKINQKSIINLDNSKSNLV